MRKIRRRKMIAKYEPGAVTRLQVMAARAELGLPVVRMEDRPELRPISDDEEKEMRRWQVDADGEDDVDYAIGETSASRRRPRSQ